MSGWNRVVKPEIRDIVRAYDTTDTPQCRIDDLYGNGKASEHILRELLIVRGKTDDRERQACHLSSVADHVATCHE